VLNTGFTEESLQVKKLSIKKELLLNRSGLKIGELSKESSLKSLQKYQAVGSIFLF
jgi:hypothetical protein